MTLDILSVLVSKFNWLTILRLTMQILEWRRDETMPTGDRTTDRDLRDPGVEKLELSHARLKGRGRDVGFCCDWKENQNWTARRKRRSLSLENPALVVALHFSIGCKPLANVRMASGFFIFFFLDQILVLTQWPDNCSRHPLTWQWRQPWLVMWRLRSADVAKVAVAFIRNSSQQISSKLQHVV